MANDKKDHVVVVNGQRASELMSQEEAQQEAQSRKQLAETQGNKSADVAVKQNLCG